MLILVVSLNMIHKHMPIIGAKYGNWIVISNKAKSGTKTKSRRFYVQCKCGVKAYRTVGGLVTGQSTQCKDCSKASYRNKFSDEGDQLSGAYFGSIKANAKWNNRVPRFEITKEYIWQLFLSQDKRCKLSNVPITLTKNRERQTASLDRIDSSKGYIEGNVQWIHKDVNKMKMNLDQDEFIQWCNLIYLNNK